MTQIQYQLKNQLKKELHDMCVGEYKEQGAFYEILPNQEFSTPKQRVVEIGNILNQLGGFQLMQEIGLSITGINNRELDFAWSGIGEWIA